MCNATCPNPYPVSNAFLKFFLYYYMHVIQKVEVYSNTSELWAEVQSSLEELSSSMESISNPDNRTCLDKNCSGQDQSVKIDGDVINEDMEERVTPQSLFEILGGQSKCQSMTVYTYIGTAGTWF